SGKMDEVEESEDEITDYDELIDQTKVFTLREYGSAPIIELNDPDTDEESSSSSSDDD
uniref:Uncharacterized protein n=1 Tax=Acrobeloides nanus TaxID=290746 RepID=A0A914E014_9BILA